MLRLACLEVVVKDFPFLLLLYLSVNYFFSLFIVVFFCVIFKFFSLKCLFVVSYCSGLFIFKYLDIIHTSVHIFIQIYGVALSSFIFMFSLLQLILNIPRTAVFHFAVFLVFRAKNRRMKARHWYTATDRPWYGRRRWSASQQSVRRLCWLAYAISTQTDFYFTRASLSLTHSFIHSFIPSFMASICRRTEWTCLTTLKAVLLLLLLLLMVLLLLTLIAGAMQAR